MLSNVVYRPLRQDEIRVLELSAATDDQAELRCKLRHVRLHTAEYAALSYVWGLNPAQSTIRVKDRRSLGQSITARFLCDWSSTTFVQNIGSNLSRALRCLRRTDRSVRLWTDQLCINQDDPVEKPRQVELMRDIYSRATVVHAWLGPSIEDTVGTVGRVHAAFDVAEQIWSAAQNIRTERTPQNEREWLEACFAVANNGTSQDSRKPDFMRSIMQAMSEDLSRNGWTGYASTLVKQLQSDPSTMKHIPVLMDLSKSAWFSRIWILQEYGRAKSLIFHYGTRQSTHLPIFLALGLANALRSSDQFRDHFGDFDKRFLACLTARTTCTERISVIEVLKAAFNSPPPTHEATDPRDLIHARLGLASDEAEYPRYITQHYTSHQTASHDSPARVFTSVARVLLSEGVTDSLLIFKPYQWMLEPPKHLTDHTAKPWMRQLAERWTFPTWSYDWSQDGLHTFLGGYNASKGTRPQIAFIPHPEAVFGEALVMAGRQIGRVFARSDGFSRYVEAAELSKGAVTSANLHTDIPSLSASSASKVRLRVEAAHEQLGLRPSPTDVDRLFTVHDFPLARFWCWWTAWAGELKRLATLDHTSQNLAELLFRGASTALQRHTGTIIDTFGTMGDLTTLTDLSRWTTLFFSADDDRRRRAAGIELAETFFCSAWGMRVAILDTGRLCYVPEDAVEEDAVVVFDGVRAPLVLHTEDGGRSHDIVGPAHVVGAMEGETVRAGSPVWKYTIL